MRFSTLVACTAPFIIGSVSAAGLNYEDSIEALALNQVNPYDNSTGTVWFNTSNFNLEEYGLDMHEDFGFYTYSTYNYLQTISSLANYASAHNKTGDVVFLLYKFLYAGEHEATAIAEDSHMVLDMVDVLHPSFSKRDNAEGQLAHLSSTSTIPALEDLYSLIGSANMSSSSVHEKRWLKQSCGTAHKAIASSCNALLQAIHADASWHSGPRSIEYRGCVISWSATAEFQVKNLFNAAESCYNACVGGDGRISCEVWGVDLKSTKVNQCMSNRANGCS